MACVVRSPEAERDLIDIWRRVAPESPKAADRFLDQIAERILQLADFPELGPLRPDIAADARVVVVGSYLVMYRIANDRVEIVRVVHGARDVTTLL